MEATVEQIESRRLARLEQQAAHYGPQTDPAILIEIADLRHKARRDSGDQRRGSFVNSLDFDLVRSSVAALLMRVGTIETNQTADKKNRWLRQLIHDAWMIAMSIALGIILFILIRG